VRTPRPPHRPTGRRALAVVVLVVLLVLPGALAGCGGPAESVDGTTSTGGASSTSTDDEPGGCDLSDLLAGDDGTEVAGATEDESAPQEPDDDTEPCLETPPATDD
jgi:hypothetical protein